MSGEDHDTASAWWRQPTVWLVIALPIASIISSMALVTLAVRTGGDDAVSDTVQRTAQIQVSDLRPEMRASQEELTAVLRVGADFVEVLPVSGRFDRRLPLQLGMRHPVSANQDLSLRLLPSRHGWRARRVVANRNAWQIELSAADGSWQIHGRLPQGQGATHLAPALAKP